jgi:ribose transport system permease protein
VNAGTTAASPLPAPTAAATARGSAQETAARWPRLAKGGLGMLLVLGALVATFGLVTDRFLSWRTFQIVANQIPALLVVSAGMTFVLVAGGIDLSVGSVLALGGGLLGVALVRAGLPLAIAVPLCLGAGAAAGALNGLVMLRWRLPSFIVTLGMLEVARGGAYLLTSSQTQYIGARIERLAEASVLGLTAPFLIAVLVVAAGQIVLARTVFGRSVVATGTNEEAARLAGLDTRRIKLAVFTASGLLAALAAVIHTARLGAADPNAGAGLELQALAAVVVGGTSLQGGRGSVVGSLFGVLVIAVLDTGLAQAGAQEPLKRLITGAVIVAAVILDNVRQRRARGGGRVSP